MASVELSVWNPRHPNAKLRRQDPRNPRVERETKGGFAKLIRTEFQLTNRAQPEVWKWDDRGMWWAMVLISVWKGAEIMINLTPRLVFHLTTIEAPFWKNKIVNLITIDWLLFNSFETNIPIMLRNSSETLTRSRRRNNSIKINPLCSTATRPDPNRTLLFQHEISSCPTAAVAAGMQKARFYRIQLQ